MESLDIRKIKSYVINLDKNKDRYENLIKGFLNIGIKPNRFKAVYAKDLNDEYINNVTHPIVQYSIKNGRSHDYEIGTYGAIGCSLSHIKLWELLLSSDQDMFLILEDDAFPKDNSVKYINNINEYINKVNTIDREWDIIYLGWGKHEKGFLNGLGKVDKNDKDLLINSNHNIYKINSFLYCTHSYIINKKGALKLLNNALPILCQLDSYISLMCMYRNINAYRGDCYIIQTSYVSDIQTDSTSNCKYKLLMNKYTYESINLFIRIFKLCIIICILFLILVTYLLFKYYL